EFELPLVQRYDAESARHRVRLTFRSQAEQYFRLPVAAEHASSDQAPDPPRSGKLAVFSDFRACGVQVDVQIWQRDRTLAQQAAERATGSLVTKGGQVPAEVD